MGTPEDRAFLPIPSWVGSLWRLRGAKGCVLGEVVTVDGEMLSLAIDGAASEPGDCGARIPTVVTTRSLLKYWEPVDRGRSRFRRRHGERSESERRT